jgi:hypothetical protein
MVLPLTQERKACHAASTASLPPDSSDGVQHGGPHLHERMDPRPRMSPHRRPPRVARGARRTVISSPSLAGVIDGWLPVETLPEAIAELREALKDDLPLTPLVHQDDL